MLESHDSMHRMVAFHNRLIDVANQGANTWDGRKFYETLYDDAVLSTLQLYCSDVVSQDLDESGTKTGFDKAFREELSTYLWIRKEKRITKNRYAELFHTINLVQLELEKFNARNTFIEP